jgi:nucleoside transporter
MSVGLRIRLSIMMFLQYFVWGTWLAMLGQQLVKNGVDMDGEKIGWMYTVYGFGSILGPFIIAQLADRFFASEKVMAFCHLVGGLILIGTAYVTTFWPIFLLLFLYCNLYMPTMGLTNSITFRSLGEANQSAFPSIRFWGTVGWIAAGLFFGFYLTKAESIAALKPFFDLVGKPDYRDCFRVAGVASIIYGFYCFTLPHTPPIPAKATDPIDKKSAILEALELMRFRSFAVLTIVAALFGIMLAFYFTCENLFLEHAGTDPKLVGSYMTIGQIAEAVVMLVVPLTVAKLGVKKTMLLGAGMWALRFGLSMLGSPWWLMIATIGLHGFCFGFFFVVAQMYVDRAASGDIKASAQNLLIFLIYGIGTIVGSVLAGVLMKRFGVVTKGLPHTGSDWMPIWAGPFILTLLSMAIFALLFREEELRKPSGSPEPALAA